MKRKADFCDANDNHGLSWWRGPLLGKGGFGSVYLATLKKPKTRTGVFPPLMAAKSSHVSVSTTLQKEKEIFSHLLDSPYILKCYGDETTTHKNGDMVYNLLLEYASGGTLSGLIDKLATNGFGLPESDVKKYTRCILKGVHYIHRQDCVHCDLKPDNVLLVPEENGQFTAKICDFGLAKKRTTESCTGGTVSYMAPETVLYRIQGPASDIWALGCVVYEMFTGKNVWDSMRKEEVLRKIGDRNELPKIPDGISKEGKEFLRRCLVKNPKFRFTAEMLLRLPFVSELDDVDNGTNGSEITENCDLSSSCSAEGSAMIDKDVVVKQCPRIITISSTV